MGRNADAAIEERPTPRVPLTKLRAAHPAAKGEVNREKRWFWEGAPDRLRTAS
jgi:hypothetical protein